MRILQSLCRVRQIWGAPKTADGEASSQNRSISALIRDQRGALGSFTNWAVGAHRVLAAHSVERSWPLAIFLLTLVDLATDGSHGACGDPSILDNNVGTPTVTSRSTGKLNVD